MNCKHEAFHVNCNVSYLEDRGQFMADISISCTQCNIPFHFPGFEMGLSLAGKPMINVDGTELRTIIKPGPMLIPSFGFHPIEM